MLARLVDEPEVLSRVVLKAIEICHFDVERFKAKEMRPGSLADVTDAQCVAGCYRCLLSYYNQVDHDEIDRRDPKFREMLALLARARIVPREIRAQKEDAAEPAAEAFRDAIVARGLQPFDTKPLVVDGVALPFSWRAERVVALYEDQYQRLRDLLEERSLIAVRLARGHETRPDLLAALGAALGGGPK